VNAAGVAEHRARKILLDILPLPVADIEVLVSPLRHRARSPLSGSAPSRLAIAPRAMEGAPIIIPDPAIAPVLITLR